MDKFIATLIIVATFLSLTAVITLVVYISRLFKKKSKLKNFFPVFIFFIVTAAIGSSFFYMALFLQTFSRYTAEEKVGWVYAKSDSNLIWMTYYDAREDSLYSFKLLGDQWMIEGKFMRWNLFLRFLGKGAYYKISRFSGRWETPGGKSSFYEIEKDPGAWSHILKYYRQIPFVETAYGIGAFQYADNDTFDIYINDTGFILRRR